MVDYLAVSASAGSGKTFKLSVRVVSLILSGASINTILALTFTNKAADEMKSKIVDLFLNLETEKKEAELKAIMDMFGWSKSEVIAKRDEIKDDFLKENLKISTIDSFFSTIVKSFSLNLGINPDFEVVNDIEFKILVRKQFLKDLNKSQIEQLANFVSQSDYAKLENTFELIESLYEKSDDFKYQSGVSFPSCEDINQTLSKINSFFAKKGLGTRGLNTLKPGTPSDIAQRGFIQKNSFEYWDYKNKFEPFIDEELQILKEQLRKYFIALESYNLSNLNSLLEIYSNSRKKVTIKENKLTFFDIAKYAYELLSKDEFKELLYFRLDAKITHLLIDEFQDTSVLQYKILKPLIDEIVSGFGQNGKGSFFYVGDPKQSIYRFRGGVKELFGSLKNAYPQIKEESLDTNFRSDGVIVDFINSLFASRDTFNYTPQLTSKSHIDKGFVEVISANQNVASLAALKAKEMIDRGAMPSSIAILCWKNADIDTLKDELDKLGIKSGGVGGELLFDTPFVRAILECIKFYITQEEIYALNVKALLGKDLKFSDFSLNLHKNVALNVIDVANFLNISLDEISSFVLASKKYENIVELAFANDETKSGQTLKSGVTLMTIHKSKGLQFDHLIVCDRMSGDSNKSDKIMQEFDSNSFKWEFAYKISGRENVDKEYQKLLQKSKTLDEDENLNKIYVALTRAVHSLIVVKNEILVEGKKINPTFFSVIGEKEPFFYIENLKLGNFEVEKVETVPKKTPKPINLVKVDLQKVDSSDKEVGDKDLISYGVALHYTLERMINFSKEALNLAIIKSKNRYGKFLSNDKFDSIKSRVLHLLNDNKFREILENGKIYKELPIKLESSLRFIDLLVIKDSEIIIVDYKTGVSYKNSHKAQVLEYKKTIMPSFVDQNIRCMICYILEDEISIKEV